MFVAKINKQLKVNYKMVQNNQTNSYAIATH